MVELFQGSSSPARASSFHQERPSMNSCNWKVSRSDLCVTLGHKYQRNRCTCFTFSSSSTSQMDVNFILKISRLCPILAWPWQKKTLYGTIRQMRGRIHITQIWGFLCYSSYCSLKWYKSYDLCFAEIMLATGWMIVWGWEEMAARVGAGRPLRWF